MKKFEQEFKSRIPEILEESTLNRTNLSAHYNGVSTSSLYRWSLGGWPPIEILLQIAEEKQTNISYLLGITDINYTLDRYEVNLNLSEKMEEANITSSVLAKEIGTSSRIVKEYIDNPRYTRIKTLVGMAFAMGMSVDYLLGLTDLKDWYYIFLKEDPFYLCEAGKPVFIIKEDKKKKKKKKSKSAKAEGFGLMHLDGENVVLPTGDIVNKGDSIFTDAVIIPVSEIPSSDMEFFENIHKILNR